MFTKVMSLAQLPYSAMRKMDEAVTAGSLSNARAAERDNDMRKALRAASEVPGSSPRPVRSA